MKKGLPLLVFALLFLGAMTGRGQDVPRAIGVQFLPAAGIDSVGDTETYVAWDIGAVASTVSRSADGSIALVSMPLPGMDLIAPLNATPVEELSSIPLSVAPNPARLNAILEWEANAAGLWQIEIYNTLGQQTANMEVPIPGRATIDCSNLPNGVYILRLLLDGNPMGQTKLLVQR